ncbi:protein FAM221B [Psammomys obesus]|uniref:protein FAM221B n=1 Tax=Psammomys obesus TaxID=48139 RepID=UPI002452B72D|nr:protein FAM221B [Psammomys obesus]
MEANEITEGPQTTTTENEHPSLKDSSAENLQEATVPETHSLRTSVQPPASKVLFETSIFQNTEMESCEEPWEAPVQHSLTEELTSLPSQVLKIPDSRTLLKSSSQSVISLVKAISKNPLGSDETLSSEVKAKSHPSPSTSILEYFRKLSSDKVSQTQVPESEYFPKQSVSGPSTQTEEDTSTRQEEASKDEPEAGTSNITVPPAKKKEKKIGFTGQQVVPAKEVEVIQVAKAMHREQIGTQANHLFEWEKDSSLKSIQTGLYIGWRCPHYLWDCFRIGDESKCFCGHLLKEHQIISDLSVPCNVSQCRCLMFCFIPSRPEEVGEFWLKRRATFDPKAWRAQCRCKHTHEEHAATGAHPCRHRGCSCNCFESNFLCAACDRRWEEHETFFETEETRRRGRRPCGTANVNNWYKSF